MAKRKKKSVAEETAVQQSVVTFPDEEQGGAASGNETDHSHPDSHLEFDILMETAKGVASDIKGILREELIKKPYKTLGLALSVGYMLGGGSSKVRGSFLVSMVGRMVAKSVFSRLLEALAKKEEGAEHEDELYDDSEQ